MNNKLAFVFPGQGSQSSGMLDVMAEDHPQISETFEQASAVLGYDLWSVVQTNPDDKLNQTEVTQPALLTASIAVWRAWLAKNGDAPVLFAGHSLGEYSALVCAGVIPFEQAVSLVQKRGQLMQEAVKPGEGAMAAILGLEDSVVEELCEQSVGKGIVSPANYNSAGQLVIAGEKDAVEQVCTLAKEAGARRALILPVSVPSHCALMLPAAEKFSAELEQVDFENAATPVIQNVDAKSRTDAAEIKAALVRQLHESVRWTQSIEYMANSGISDIIECGPGKVLAGLIKRIDRNLRVYPVSDSETLETALIRE